MNSDSKAIKQHNIIAARTHIGLTRETRSAERKAEGTHDNNNQSADTDTSRSPSTAVM